jgi:hypothetical protein
MRRLSVALDQLLDPLGLPEASGVAEGRRAGTREVVVGDPKSAPERRPGRDSRFERLATAFKRLRWRQANAVYRLRWSQATRYRLARLVLTSALIFGISCGLVILLLATMQT